MTTASPPDRTGREVKEGRRVIRCPRCGGASVYAPTNAFRPFCSERCRDIDFGTWAAEAYRVAARPDPEDPAAELDETPGG